MIEKSFFTFKGLVFLYAISFCFSSFSQSQRFYHSQVFQKQKLKLNWNQLSKQKIIKEKNPGMALNNFTSNPSAILPQKLQLSISVDMRCYKSATQSPWLKQLVETQKHPTLKVQYFTHSLEETQSVAELESKLENEPYVIGGSEEGKLYANAVGDYVKDPLYDDQHHLNVLELEEGIPTMYESSIRFDPNSKAIVAVVDSGINYLHDDLKNQMWTDANGFFGYDFVNNDNDPLDDQSHGSHCSGIIGAESSNDIGVSGIISFNVEFMAVKVLDENNGGPYTGIANGIRYAAENGADLINLSLGGGGPNAMIEDALKFAVEEGATVFAAAGNSNQFVDANNFYIPQGYAKDINGFVSVGSYDAITKLRSGFSNYNPEYVEMGAPGGAAGQGDILSTVLGQNYDGYFGTSMATPAALAVAGIAVIFFKSHDIDYTPAMIEDIVTNGSVVNNNLTQFFTNGRQANIPSTIDYIIKNYFIESDGSF